MTNIARFSAAVFIFTVCLIIFLFHPISAAQSEAEVTVSKAAGKAGETVNITVGLAGLDSVSGITGLSGGQFELVYDPELASVESIKRGNIIGSGFTFITNRNYTQNSIKVTFVSGMGLITQDGDFCTITFLLKKDGAIAVLMQNLVLYDQDVQPVTMRVVVTGDDEQTENETGNGNGANEVPSAPGSPDDSPEQGSEGSHSNGTNKPEQTKEQGESPSGDSPDNGENEENNNVSVSPDPNSSDSATAQGVQWFVQLLVLFGILAAAGSWYWLSRNRRGQGRQR